jgi:hypothetical protein
MEVRMMLLIALVMAIAVAALLFLLFRCKQQLQSYRARYSGIIDADAELASLSKKLGQAKIEQQQSVAENERRRQKLDEDYAQALNTYKRLQQEISVLEENLEDISFGLYKPHFTFQSPEAYKEALTNTRDKERELIRNNRAAVCPLNWTVGDSKREGQRMVRLSSKLLLRAFNGECDAAIANVSWNNAVKMEERLRKSFEAVNKLCDVLKVTLTQEYLDLKLAELRLTHEYEEKKYEERETMRRQREEQREEERAQQEIEKARQVAEEDETRYQKLLGKAREEAAIATGAQLKKLTEQVSAFESKLDEARKKKERAIARAQLTKSGFVYVISNIGSFGERIYKIGMTRRMEPMDRVVELGGASVPFPFDLHAMLYSDNAPELEGALHHFFEERRLNLVNPRREFYRDVELEEVEQFVKTRGLSAQFVKLPEAREYRETLAKREQILSVKRMPSDSFADTLFQTASAD